MAQQTAVQWLFDELMKNYAMNYSIAIQINREAQIWAQAKQMEKEQIMKSFKSARIPYKYDADLTLNGFEDAEQYYNETFGKQ